MCMSDLRHIHDPVLLSLKMESISFIFPSPNKWFYFFTCLHVSVGLQVTKYTIRFMNNFSINIREPVNCRGRFFSLSPSFTYFLPFPTVICAVHSFSIQQIMLHLDRLGGIELSIEMPLL
jgi:hypothetical protein